MDCNSQDLDADMYIIILRKLKTIYTFCSLLMGIGVWLFRSHLVKKPRAGLY